MPSIAYLECSRCHARLSAATAQTVCTRCPDQPAGALYVRYDLSHLHGTSPDSVVPGNTSSPWPGMWRYAAVLPDVTPVTLGEGWTPMLRSKRNANVFLKEEGANPTGSFKARGLALAVTMARHYGLRKLAVPSAGNAAGALAAYAAAADIEAHIFMPRDVPFANYVEATAYGAKVTLVDGLISDCARMVAERQRSRRLVRHFHAQGTVPHRRQEDHGLRTGRAARLGISRRGVLSDRRRRGPDRHVEGVRGAWSNWAGSSRAGVRA